MALPFRFITSGQNPLKQPETPSRLSSLLFPFITFKQLRGFSFTVILATHHDEGTFILYNLGFCYVSNGAKNQAKLS